MQGADLVTGRIAQISKVQFHAAAFTHTRWIFTGSAAVRDTGRVPGVCLFRCFHGKADGAAVAVGGGLAIDGLAKGESTGLGEIEAAAFIIDNAGFAAHNAENRIVEGFGSLNIVGAEHDMTEHDISLLVRFIVLVDPSRFQ